MQKASFTNHLHFPATEPVTGLYWGLRTDLLSRGGWKIDLWGVTAEVCAERLRHCERIGAALDGERRASVLAIKNDVCRDRRYRDTVTSQHVYDAVIAGVRTTDAFWRWWAAATG